MIDSKGYAHLLRVARSCGVSADAAADLVQETVLKLLEKPPQDNVLAYATAVLRNLFRRRWRAAQAEQLVTLDVITPAGETYARADSALIVQPEQERWAELREMAVDIRRRADRRSLMVASAPQVLISLAARPLRGDRREAIDVRRAIRLHERLHSWAAVARTLTRSDGSRFNYVSVYNAVMKHRRAEAAMLAGA